MPQSNRPLQESWSPLGTYNTGGHAANSNAKGLLQESDCKVLLRRMQLLDITGRWSLFFVSSYAPLAHQARRLHTFRTKAEA